MKFGRTGVLLSLLFVLSCIAAFFGVTLSYQRHTVPEKSYGLFSKIHRDGWIEDGATINPRLLYHRGNQMRLDFKSWRPAGQPPAELGIALCGEEVSRVTVDRDFAHTVYLTGDCEPREVRFTVYNPFTPSESDQRKLGAQLKSVTITSVLGVPIVQPEILVVAAGAIFLLSVLFFLVAMGTSWTALPFLIPLLALELTRNALYMKLYKLVPVWWSAMLIGVGLLIGRRFFVSKQEDNPEQRNSFIPVVVALAVTIGGALRFYGLDFGLPSNFHPDEVPKVNAVMRMYQSGTLNPQYFLHPSLLLYATYFVNLVFHLFGIEGTFQETAVIAGRTVSALAGTGSLYLTYCIGKRLVSPWTGALSSILLAVMPLHVTGSRYLKEDALLLFVVLAAVLVTLKAVQEERPRLLLLAGVLAGCSAAVKYSGMLSVAIVLGAPWLRSQKIVPDLRFLGWALGGVLLMPLAFLCCTPYALLDSKRFLHDFRHEQGHMSRGHTHSISAWSQYWMYHLSRSIVPGMTWVVAVLSLAGVGFFLARGKIHYLYLICLVLLFYLPAEFVKAKPAPQPERYIFPCLPFLAVLAAGLLDGIRRMNVARGMVVLLALFALFVSGARTFQLTGEITDDTRDQMAAWIGENIPAGSKVYIDHKRYSPELSTEQFEVVYAPRAQPYRDLGWEQLRAMEVDYLLLSSLWYDRYFSQPRTEAHVKKRLEQVFETFPVVKKFVPKHGTYGFHNPTVWLFALHNREGERTTG